MISHSTFVLLQNIGTGVWLIVIAAALVRGGRPERAAAVVLLADLAAVELFRGYNRLGDVQWRNLVGDLVVLIVLAGLAFAYRRRWLPWAVGVQIAAVLVHVPRMIDPAIRNVGYATIAAVLGYGVVALLLWGVMLEAGRARVA